MIDGFYPIHDAHAMTRPTVRFEAELSRRLAGHGEDRHNGDTREIPLQTRSNLQTVKTLLEFSGTEILGKGVYTIAEAARLTRLRPRRVQEWFRGRTTARRIFKPVFESDYPVFHEEYAISFLDLIELKIGGSLREMGVSLPYLRTVYHNLELAYGDHPFCYREIYVGGKQIFTRGLEEKAGHRVIEALTNQSYFEAIILPFLEKIEYNELTNQAARWRISPLVVVDPKIRFGKPIVEEVGIATSVLRKSYYANGEDAEVVARWFEIEARHVQAAVDFENSLAA